LPYPCPGRCAGGEVPRNNGEPVWCSSCAQVVRSALRAIPEAYTALDAVRFYSRSAPADAVRVSGSKDRPSVAPGVDLRDEMFHTLRCWEDDVRLALRHRGSRDGADREETLDRSVRYLNRNFESAIKRDPGGLEFGQEIHSLFVSALRLLKNGPIRSRLTITCPRCSRRSLVQQEGIAGRPWVTVCDERLAGCGTLYTEVEMTWVVEMRKAVAA